MPVMNIGSMGVLVFLDWMLVWMRVVAFGRCPAGSMEMTVVIIVVTVAVIVRHHLMLMVMFMLLTHQ